MKKFALIFSVVAIIFLMGVGVYAVLQKDNSSLTEDISLEVEDIELKVGEESKIEYSVSSKNLVIVMEIEDVDIAQLKSLSTGFYVTGLKEGSSILNITAFQGEEKVTRIAKIVVSNDDDKVIDDPTPIDDSPEIIDSDNPNDNNEEPENPVSNDLVVEFPNLFKCEYANETFTIETNKISMFSISCNKNIDTINIISQNENLEITSASDIGNNTYKITALLPGEYTFDIHVNGYIFSYKVIAV